MTALWSMSVLLGDEQLAAALGAGWPAFLGRFTDCQATAHNNKQKKKKKTTKKKEKRERDCKWAEKRRD